MIRYTFPSTRTAEYRLCVVPVQCRVCSSVSESDTDHTLKYGSCATSGTAGGRSPCASRREGSVNAVTSSRTIRFTTHLPIRPATGERRAVYVSCRAAAAGASPKHDIV